MRTLIVFAPSTTSRSDRAEQQRREANDESPRKLLFEEALSGDVLDTAQFVSLPWFLRALYRLLPAPVSLALEAYRRRNRYDVVVSWDDRIAVIYAFLLVLGRSRSRHVAIVSWMATLKKGIILKLVQRGIDRILVFSQDHIDLLVEFFSIPRSKIVEIPYFVDQQFWRPMQSATLEGVSAAGDSKRDYATLIEAVQDLPVTCSIVTQVKPEHQGSGDWVETGKSLASISELPNNVVIGPASPTELRATYARSRFVILPLVPGYRNIGFTALAEAMAMGKAVICTRTYGLAEFLDEGKNGMSVPPGDPVALRTAIEYLLEHPAIAEQMGEQGRRWAEEVFALDLFVANIRQVVDSVITGNQTHSPTIATHVSLPTVVVAGQQ